ncbi:hypothetical protein [Paramesorhizobium deserti]|nr:hypothetical protein [Paramesorhizobium deserti]
MSNRTSIALLGISMLATGPFHALAADHEAKGNDQNGNWQVPAECRAQPGDGRKDDKQGETREALAERLERCRSVLKPPPTGDTEADIPPPDVGKTPVIPPRAIPDQPSDN